MALKIFLRAENEGWAAGQESKPFCRPSCPAGSCQTQLWQQPGCCSPPIPGPAAAFPLSLVVATQCLHPLGCSLSITCPGSKRAVVCWKVGNVGAQVYRGAGLLFCSPEQCKLPWLGRFTCACNARCQEVFYTCISCTCPTCHSC